MPKNQKNTPKTMLAQDISTPDIFLENIIDNQPLYIGGQPVQNTTCRGCVFQT